jgi:hypothetical protein
MVRIVCLPATEGALKGVSLLMVYQASTSLSPLPPVSELLTVQLVMKINILLDEQCENIYVHIQYILLFIFA